jgi:hypothetical protein
MNAVIVSGCQSVSELSLSCHLPSFDVRCLLFSIQVSDDHQPSRTTLSLFHNQQLQEEEEEEEEEEDEEEEEEEEEV